MCCAVQHCSNCSIVLCLIIPIMPFSSTVCFYLVRSESVRSWCPSWRPTSMSLLKTAESKILACKISALSNAPRTEAVKPSACAGEKPPVCPYIGNTTVTQPGQSLTSSLLVVEGIHSDLWARFVTLPNQNRIWTLTITNKLVRKPAEQGNECLGLLITESS